MSDFNIKLIPDNISMTVDDEQIIMVTYIPNDYDNQTGDWYADPEYFNTIISSDSFIKVKALKEGTTSIIYTPAADPSKAKLAQVSISKENDGSLTLSPTSETVNNGDDFYIDVIYADGNSFKPIWVYDHSIIKKLDDSTDHRAHFQALRETDENGTVLTCMLGKEVANNICVVVASDLNIKLIPETTTQLFGSNYYVNIDYSPDNGNETGSWDDDNTFIELLPDSTPYRAHFKIIKYSDEPIKRTYTSHGISVTHTCNIATGDLKQIAISSPLSKDGNHSIEVVSGTEIPVNVEYIPNYAPHVCFPQTGWADSYGDNFISPDLVKSNNDVVYYNAKYPSNLNTIYVTNTDSDDSSSITSNIILVKIKGVPCESFKFNEHTVTRQIKGDVINGNNPENILTLKAITVPEYSLLPSGKWIISDPEKVQKIDDKSSAAINEFKFKLLGGTKPNIPIAISYMSDDGKLFDTCYVTIKTKPIVNIKSNPDVTDINKPFGKATINLVYEPEDCVYGITGTDVPGQSVYQIKVDGYTNTTIDVESISKYPRRINEIVMCYPLIQDDDPNKGKESPYYTLPVKLNYPIPVVHLSDMKVIPQQYDNASIGEEFTFSVKYEPEGSIKGYNIRSVDKRLELISHDDDSFVVKLISTNVSDDFDSDLPPSIPNFPNVIIVSEENEEIVNYGRITYKV